MCEAVLGRVPDFIDFDIHLPTFLWQLRCFVEKIIRKRLSDSLFIAVVRQHFVLGINCSIFLYLNSFGANQPLALTGKSFRIAQVLLCAVQQDWV